MKKASKKGLLNSRVTSISTNTIDRILRIEVNNRWFMECKDPSTIFGKPLIHEIRKPKK